MPEALQRELTALKERYEELEEQVETFTHSVNINLQGIIADAESILLSLETRRYERATGDSKDLIDKIGHLLLALNNSKPNLGDYEFATCNLGKMVEVSKSVFEGYAAERGIEICVTNLFERGPYVRVSRNHFQHALHNLIHNAVKYSYSRQLGRPRTVDVLIRSHSKDYVMMKIVNYGVPIDSDELGKIVNNGYRGRHSQERYRTGSGRGLFHVHSIVSAHQGELTINCKDVKGGAGVTTVMVHLPLEAEGGQDEKHHLARG